VSARSPVLVRELPAPGRVLRQLAISNPSRYPALFDSAADGPLSRASVLAAEPCGALWLTPDGELHADARAASVISVEPNTKFLDALDRWWQHERLPTLETELPFSGGWVVYFGYELAQEIEPRLHLPRETLPWRAFALRVPCAVIHDRLANRVLVVAEDDARGRAALERVTVDVLAAVSFVPENSSSAGTGPLPARQIREESPDAYLERVRRAKEYIRAGDIYQANLSRRWDVELDGEPNVAALYDRLCVANPAPFAALIQWNGAAVLSSSPERLARVTADRVIETRPIAGTRPRSRVAGGDLSEITELAAHPKERAEHVMLIDLERNDLGRVCEPGSVHVDEFMSIESYAHVHHIVSNVSGKLRADVTPVEALKAVFPGGTITGVPKIRCMQIIGELEGVGRGAYTGSVGFLSRDGVMDTNILIRTMIVTGQHVELRAGAGIVADSVPERELEETRAKARGLLAVFAVDPIAIGA